MDTMFNQLQKESKGAVQEAERKHLAKAAFFNQARHIIEELPSGENDYFYHYTGVRSDDSCNLCVTYYSSSNEIAEGTRSAVQAILHEIAYRDVESFSGKINYKFDKDLVTEDGLKHHLTVIINNGKMAPGCEIVPETTTTTTYRLVCPGGENDA